MACDACACGNVADQVDQVQTKDCMEVDEESLRRNKALQATGAQLIDGDFVRGIRIGGWSILTRKAPILKMGPREKWEKTLGTIHLPEMVFGDNSLELVHEATGVKIHFNALDALRRWRQESLPPVQIPAAAKWKFRTKPDEQVILDYDYTFTTPYAGSQCVDNRELAPHDALAVSDDILSLPRVRPGMEPDHVIQLGAVDRAVEWVESQERIDMTALQARDPILFYDEVVLYEDELADNGISLLTAKVMRVDGALMRLRDTRMFCQIQSGSTAFPVVIRERSIKEDTFDALASRGYPKDSAMYNDPNVAAERLSQKHHFCENLTLKSPTK